MSPAYGVYEYLGATGGRFHLYAPAQNTVLRERFETFANRSARPSEPPRVLEFDDVVLSDSPSGVCLYDSNGRRIEESCLARYTDDLQPEMWRAAETIDARPIKASVTTPVVYQSAFFRHWGHFLLESLNRAWASVAEPKLAGLPCVFPWALGAGPLAPSYRAFFEAAGLELATLEGEPRKTRLSKCFLPTASFATVAYADPLHLAAPHRAARQLLADDTRDPRPVYLSRTTVRPHADSRPTIQNEMELEQALAARGARIVHMETLSLAEQIAVMNAHSVFIGPWGSALHNVLFSLRGPEISTYVMLPRFLPTNYMLVDTIVGNDAHYLVVLSRVDSETNRQFIIDLEKTLAYLDSRGVFA